MKMGVLLPAVVLLVSGCATRGFVREMFATKAVEDTWADPFPGVRWLHRVTESENVNALFVDLCAVGVSVRATAESERGRTVSSFAELVGVQAAVNGDFGDPTIPFHVDGPAMHAGALWGGQDHDYVSPVAFGDRHVTMKPHWDLSGPEPWWREVVSGHPTLLVGRAPVDNNRGSFCTVRHPRTAVGLTADRRTLIVVTVDGRAPGRDGMTCDEMSALFFDLGADDATNLDGGGSTTMWLEGAGVVNYPSDATGERTVANHLGVYATGSGAAPHCPDTPPRPEGEGGPMGGENGNTRRLSRRRRAALGAGAPVGLTLPYRLRYRLAWDHALCRAMRGCMPA
jgi:hypothetical protein